MNFKERLINKKVYMQMAHISIHLQYKLRLDVHQLQVASLVHRQDPDNFGKTDELNNKNT